jgi:glycerol uptake facilitator-like aquaporin
MTVAAALTSARTCFFEQGPPAPLRARAAAEALGTFLLVIAAAGSAATGARLAPGMPAVSLFVSAAGTSSALVALIFTFGKVSGGHFHPLITGLQWVTGERTLQCALNYWFAQLTGAVLGALVVRMSFLAPAPLAAASSAFPLEALMGSETLASMALMLVVFGCSRSGLITAGPVAAGGWLLAAILATPSTSYANPAITIAAGIAGGPTGLPLSQVLAFIPAQVAGAALALVGISFIFKRAETS